MGVRRTFSPTSFISHATEGALLAVPIYAWDVMSASRFVEALGVADKMLVNRWLYRGACHTPPFEPAGKWVSGRGGSRVIRKDKAIAWARTGGQSLSNMACWRFAAEDLAAIGWPNLGGPAEVQDILNFLFDHGVIRHAVPLRRWTERRDLYA
jgi:hypothetical protein